MSRTVYVNGEYLPEEQATVSIFDRVAPAIGDAVVEHRGDALVNRRVVGLQAELLPGEARFHFEVEVPVLHRIPGGEGRGPRPEM